MQLGMVIFNGDYHWIEFDGPFKLNKHVNYTYEIRTGSYPKSIHNHTLKTSGEKITCLSLNLGIK